MKNLILLLIPFLLFSSCSIDWNDEKDRKITELEKQINQKSSTEELTMNFKGMTLNKISKEARLIKCEWKYDSSMVVSELGWINEWTISINSENFEVTILWDKLTMFWAEFWILENSDDYLIAMRTYNGSGLTELLQLNRNNGVLYDSKTYTRHIWNAPAWFDTIFTCKIPL